MNDLRKRRFLRSNNTLSMDLRDAGIALRAYQDADRERILELYRDAFGLALIDSDELSDLITRLTRETAWVAVNDEELVVGFATVEYYEAESDTLRKDVAILTAALMNFGLDEAIKKLDQDHLKAEAGTARIDRLLSEKERSREYVVPGPGDACFAELAVDPLWRRKGIARALVKQRMVAVQAQGARQVVVHLWDKSPAGVLYQELGFTPLLYIKPYYSDGGATTIMRWRASHQGLQGTAKWLHTIIVVLFFAYPWIPKKLLTIMIILGLSLFGVDWVLRKIIVGK